VACCVSGGAVVEAGSGVAAHWRRLQAAALLSQAAERRILPLSFSSVSFPLLLLLWFSFPLFSVLSVLSSSSPLSLSFGFFSFSSSLLCFSRFFFSFVPLFSSPPLLLCWLLFIEPSEWLSLWSMGSNRPVGHWARLPRLGPPSSVFLQVRGGWSTIVSGRWAPGERVAGKKFKLKQTLFPSSPLHVRGEEER